MLFYIDPSFIFTAGKFDVLGKICFIFHFSWLFFGHIYLRRYKYTAPIPKLAKLMLKKVKKILRISEERDI